MIIIYSFFRPGHEPHVGTGTTEVMTFYPTWEQFADFPAYIRHIEEQGAHTSCGIAKVIFIYFIDL